MSEDKKNPIDILLGIQGVILNFDQCLPELPDLTDSYRETYSKRLVQKIVELNSVIDTITQLQERNKELEEALKGANHTLSHLTDSLQPPQRKLVNQRIEEFRLLLAKETEQ
jgi:hypothetical protein